MAQQFQITSFSVNYRKLQKKKKVAQEKFKSGDVMRTDEQRMS